MQKSKTFSVDEDLVIEGLDEKVEELGKNKKIGETWIRLFLARA
jgi:uncharacterized protein YjaZ